MVCSANGLQMFLESSSHEMPGAETGVIAKKPALACCHGPHPNLRPMFAIGFKGRPSREVG